MWSTILLLLAGFAIGVVFILLAQIAWLAFLAVVFDNEMKVAFASASPSRDALCGYVVAVCREHDPARRRLVAGRSDFPFEGVSILHLAGPVFVISAFALILKAIQS
jgi:hypothetical protein